MQNKMYRKESLDHVFSPEELHDYMHVTTPHLWMYLLAVVSLLAGFLFLASTVAIENTKRIEVKVESGVPAGDAEKGGEEKRVFLSCTLPFSEKDLVEPGMTVKLGGEKGKIVSELIRSDVDADKSALFVIEMDREDFYLPEGTYEAEVVLETVTPISFLFQ